jgi:putative peptidoglycan lipid II flippase
MALIRASLVVGGNTLISRVLGYGRDILIARALGTAGVVEGFVVAFRLPNLFRRLVAEGAFAAAFVPFYARVLETRGAEAARAFAERALALMIAALVAFTVAAEIFMPAIVGVLAPGFRDQPALFDATVLFARLTMPYLLCMAVVALMSGALNAHYKFAAAAAAPTLLNVVLIAGLLWAAPWFQTPAHMLSWGVGIAGVAQYLALGWACHRAGIRLRLPRPRLTPDMKRLLKLMVPGAIGAGVTQVNLLVGTIVASFIPGAVAILYFADRLYQFPLGMIGIAIGTALLPELSRRLVGDPPGALHMQNRALEFALLLALPATGGLIALAEPLAVVMFQYGKFTAADARLTALALAAFSAGLPAYVLIRVLSPAFYARHDTRTPVRHAVLSMVVNVSLSVALVWPPFGLWPSAGLVGVAAATAVAAWLNVVTLSAALARRGHFPLDARLKARAPRLLLAALAMAAALLPLRHALAGWLAGGIGERVAALALLVAAGAVFYGVLVLALRAARLGELRAALRRPPKAPKAPPPAA